jgi:DNA repair ATPase RecN
MMTTTRTIRDVLRSVIKAERRQYDVLRQLRLALTEDYADAKHNEEEREQQLELVDSIAEQVYRERLSLLEQLCNRCLTVLDDPYEVELRPVQRRNKTEVDLVLTRDGEDFDALSETAGGAVDLVSFALRLGAILFDKSLRPLLVLDEPFRFVSAKYRPRIKQVLEELVSELDFQVIMVTHLAELIDEDAIQL